MRYISVFLVTAFVLGVGIHVSATAQTPSPQVTTQITAGALSDVGEGSPVTIPGALQFDFTSQINGRDYRIFIATPENYQPTLQYPVLYVLDGNWQFRNMYRGGSNSTADSGIIVGIGYQTEDRGEIGQARTFDYTPSPSGRPGSSGGGGLDAFLRVIEEEVKPFVMARYRIDPARQGLYGYSLGGLAVLRSLFRNPGSFSTYIAGSPSIWWNNREVLEDEAAFSTRARAGEMQLKLLITSAADEQYRGDDPQLLAEPGVALGRMVDNASELAARLAGLNPEQITVVRTIFEGEVHNSASGATRTRAFRFAFAPVETTLAPELLARYAGVYELASQSMITVKQLPDGLTLERTGMAPRSLAAASDTKFFFYDAGDLERITFESDSTGKVTGLVGVSVGTAKKVQ